MTFACICIAAKDPTLFFFMILFLVFCGRQNTGQSLEEAADSKGKPQAGPGRPAGAAAASQPPRLPREPLPPALGSDTHARPRSPISSSRRHPGRWPGRTSSESAPRCERLGAPALPAAHLPGCPADPPGLPSPAPSPGDTPVAQKPEAFVHVAQVLGCRSAWTGRCGTGRCWEDLPRSLQKTGRCRPLQTLHAAEPVWGHFNGPLQGRSFLHLDWSAWGPPGSFGPQIQAGPPAAPLSSFSWCIRQHRTLPWPGSLSLALTSSLQTGHCRLQQSGLDSLGSSLGPGLQERKAEGCRLLPRPRPRALFQAPASHPQWRGRSSSPPLPGCHPHWTKTTSTLS
ncbi:uncharacterized protein LOC108293507 [Cebus imitator]|uniref:uncharacterized protein LOC108293507 n=1 Tax=Cebus imitator TaxID=2715852 RepID=UPI000809CAB8|nr:uncharacterized protein LOC108293507 [Cebus imitator]